LRKAETDPSFSNPYHSAGGPDRLGSFGKIQAQIQDLIYHDGQRALERYTGFADVEYFVEIKHAPGASGTQRCIGWNMGFVADATATVRGNGS